MLDGGGEDLFEGVDVVELGVGVVDAVGQYHLQEQEGRRAGRKGRIRRYL